MAIDREIQTKTATVLKFIFGVILNVSVCARDFHLPLLRLWMDKMPSLSLRSSKLNPELFVCMSFDVNLF